MYEACESGGRCDVLFAGIPTPPAGNELCSTSYCETSLVRTASAGRVVAELWQKLFAPPRADVTFVCRQGERVRCNRSALAAASRFFDSLLSNEWRESRQEEVKLPEVSAHVLEAYIFAHFRFGASPPSAEADDVETVLEAYELARQYCLTTLESYLLEELVRKMDICSAGWLLQRALQSDADALISKALEHLAKAWNRSETGLAIEGVQPDALSQYLESPAIPDSPVPMEHYLEAAIEWGREQLGLSEGLWKGEISQAQRDELLLLIMPLLPYIQLELIPAAALESKIEPLKILPEEQLMKIYKAQAKAACPRPCSLQQHSFWDSERMPHSVALLNSRTAEFRGFQGHAGVRSKLGLTHGAWMWKLEFQNIGRKYAWAGFVDGTVDLSVFPGSQVGGFMYGSSGLVRSKAADSTDKDRAGSNWHHHGTVVAVFLDMHRREAGFSVDGKFVGALFRNLPPCIYPAASLSGGGAVRFVSLDAVEELPW